MRTLALFGLLFALGCDGTATVGVDEEGLTTADTITRAEEWVTNQLQYCQAAYGEVDYDQACWSEPWESSDRCYRNSNTAWNPYRSDCSGLVSWAWGLAAPGRTTYGFYPFQTDITSAIDGKDLRAGDAINNSDHVMLFKDWVTAGQRAVFIEEPGCSTTVKHAHEVTVDVTLSGTQVTPAGYGMTFTAIRYSKLTTPPAGPPDPCAGLADGSYCGGDDIGGTTGTLYVCKGGNVGSSTVCKAGCKFNPPGVPDACKPEPAKDGGVAGGKDGGASGGGGETGEPGAPSETAPGVSGSGGTDGTGGSAAAPQAGCSMAMGSSASDSGALALLSMLAVALFARVRRRAQG